MSQSTGPSHGAVSCSVDGTAFLGDLRKGEVPLPIRGAQTATVALARDLFRHGYDCGRPGVLFHRGAARSHRTVHGKAKTTIALTAAASLAGITAASAAEAGILSVRFIVGVSAASAIVRSLYLFPSRLRAYSSQILHHPDWHTNSRNQIHDLTAKNLIAIHMRGRDKKIRMGPITRELQSRIGFVIERHLLPANCDSIA